MNRGSKRIKLLIALMLAALFTLLSLHGTVPQSSAKANTADTGEELFTLEPHLSDGVSITLPSEDSLTVSGHEEDGQLVFEETKQLSFTAVFGEGWSYNSAHSTFFKNDARAHITENEDGTVTFAFDAEEGASVAFSALDSIYINASCAELPKLYIDAVIPFEDIDKETWVDAEFTLTLGTKQFESGDYEGSGQVKGRGNSSWTYSKKPYSIKLEKKESLLDIPKTKKYAIIPSYNDGTLMRNFITYKIWQELIGIDYVPRCEFVDVYLNGEYRGIYILVERIDIEKNKIDVEEADEEHLSGAYLIEKNIYGKFSMNDDIWFPCPYWANQVQDFFELHAPEPDDPELLAEMLDYLTGYMQRIHESIMDDAEPYTKYVDTSSWADFIILQELSKNPDGNFKTSCWTLKLRDDEHLYMTAPWDFDFAYGLVSWTNGSEEHNDYVDCPPANTAEDFMILNSSNPWMKKLYETRPEFALAVKVRYTTYRNTLIPRFFTMIEEQAAYLSIVQQANYELWGKNFENGVYHLKRFLEGRIGWLDEQWLLEDGDADLDTALNITGGTLHFDTEGEESPFVSTVYRDRLQGRSAAGGESGFALTAELDRGEFVCFGYECEGSAPLVLTVNGEPVFALTGEGRCIFTAEEAGEYSFRWSFAPGEGETAYVDDVSINFGTIIGDVNLDGAITVSDAITVLRTAMGILDLGDQALLADVNTDGEITVSDAIWLLRTAMNLI